MASSARFSSMTVRLGIDSEGISPHQGAMHREEPPRRMEVQLTWGSAAGEEAPPTASGLPSKSIFMHFLSIFDALAHSEAHSTARRDFLGPRNVYVKPLSAPRAVQQQGGISTGDARRVQARRQRLGGGAHHLWTLLP